MASGRSIGGASDWKAVLHIPAFDRRGIELDLAPLRMLISRIVEAWHPVEIWLFGSRARGEAAQDSDWDLLVIVPDATPEDRLDPHVGWTLQKGSGVRADVVPCRETDFREARSTVNTLAYEAATAGLLVYAR